jgi:histidyl-tRNA synthetase
MRGIEDIRFVLAQIAQPEQVVLDLTLARGLNYYTGAIFEVTANGVEMGSIGGGGRYDDLTSIFGGKGLPGIGISFGLDRIVLCLEALNAFPLDQLSHAPSVMALHLGNPEEVQAVYAAVRAWRAAGMLVDFYPEAAAAKKQYAWAEQRGIRWVLQRMEGDQALLKDTSSGDVISCLVNDYSALMNLFR